MSGKGGFIGGYDPLAQDPSVFSGKWNLIEQMQARADNNWPGVVLGELYSWGSGNKGQQGQNDTISRSSPVQVGEDTDWGNVFITTNPVFSIKSNGALYGWGGNFGGLVGDNSTINRSSPVQVDSGSWSTISRSTGDNTAGIKSNGTLWTWGRNNFGNLGQNDTISRSSPTQVGALTTWQDVATSDGSCVAVRTDGTMWSWGFNDGLGLLGRNEASGANSSPIQIGALTTWASVSGGKQFFMAIKTDGTLWGWGDNNPSPKLGLNDLSNRSSPTQVGSLTNWSQVSADQLHATAIKTDGTIWSWGANSSAQLGVGDTLNRSSPVQIGALTSWTKIKAGNNNTMALKNDGGLYFAGRNVDGQAGNNNSSSPVFSLESAAGGSTGWSDFDIYDTVIAVKESTIT